ncbi:MAG TPA: peroxiredoxin [Bacteroidia bacterium]|nr:peroxiredoxin [Bacteroidia bacterium]
MSLNINHPAPLIESFNSEKQPFSLEQLKGKNVLLLFFPAAFTSTCTKELCSVRDNLSYYNNLNCTVIGISTDTIYSLAKYKEEQKLNFQLVSDFNKEIGKIYHAQYELFGLGMKGITKRAAFLIDKNGILRYIEVLENAGEIPDFNKIKSVLDNLS